METVENFLLQFKKILDFSLFTTGKTSITLWLILYLLVLITSLFYLSGKLKQWIAERLLARRGIDIGVRQATGTLIRYVIIFIGFLIILQTAGVDLSALAILTGAIGIGIGFGLQNIINNFVSGLIILFERPIKIGDCIEVGEVEGDVVKISTRATTIITNDNVAVIVPNSEFISSKVINRSYTSPDVRFDFPIGVSYDSDPEIIRTLLTEIALNHPGVLKQPKPDVLLNEFGDSSINFSLRVWTRQYTSRPGVLRSELNYAISKKFKENNIEIPFPQRDVYIRGGSLEVKSQ